MQSSGVQENHFDAMTDTAVLREYVRAYLAGENELAAAAREDLLENRWGWRPGDLEDAIDAELAERLDARREYAVALMRGEEW